MSVISEDEIILSVNDRQNYVIPKSLSEHIIQERKRRESAEKALRKVRDNDVYILDAERTAREHFEKYSNTKEK